MSGIDPSGTSGIQQGSDIFVPVTHEISISTHVKLYNKMGHRQIKQYHFIIIVLIIQRIEVNHQIGLQEQRAILKLNWIKRLSLISL